MIRNFRPQDSDECLRLFHDTVHQINRRDYSPQQVRAWAPEDVDRVAWLERFRDRVALVACEGETIVGFTDMTRDGHLDRLFVSSQHQRRGIARELVSALAERAHKLGIRSITTDASITAKPFFAAMGFQTVRQQSVPYRGERFTNFRMRWKLADAFPESS
ncbi:GNAT family N-acetyltransferase [Roseiconus nitratireducens]|uniref:GNAT family N-acetyltransferase n=2 Tax=Roseiconus nitratireducens TaxID=2605748 RepID=A0A5M6CWB0_9BACT|nr:GNAT family N-acetyltransferase [Roseiconus nitratireducens]